MRLTLPKWFDLHTHFRQGANVAGYLADHRLMGCAGALAMAAAKASARIIRRADRP
jgi:dihydroorotase